MFPWCLPFQLSLVLFPPPLAEGSWACSCDPNSTTTSELRLRQDALVDLKWAFISLSVLRNENGNIALKVSMVADDDPDTYEGP